MSPFVNRRILLGKETVALYENVQEFVVAEVDGEVVGCGALHVMWEDLGEVRSVAVSPDHGGQGIGARIVDELQLDVYAFGILADFRTRLFAGSQRLVELADRVETLPLGPLCWCGARGTHNARTVDGLMVTEGSQVVVGDTGSGREVRYEVLCRAHHRRRMTATRAKATLSPDPLPFDQQPLEAAATISACVAAWNATSNLKWKIEAERA